MVSYVDLDTINLYHGFYSRDVILDCSAAFEGKLEVQVLRITKDFCQIKLIPKDSGQEDQVIKAEFLNYLIGSSFQHIIK